MTEREILQAMTDGAFIIPTSKLDSYGNAKYMLTDDGIKILGWIRSRQIRNLFDKKLINNVNEETAEGRIKSYFVRAQSSTNYHNHTSCGIGSRELLRKSFR